MHPEADPSLSFALDLPSDLVFKLGESPPAAVKFDLGGTAIAERVAEAQQPRLGGVFQCLAGDASK